VAPPKQSLPPGLRRSLAPGISRTGIQVFQTGAKSRVVAYHYNGAPRSGFPVDAATRSRRPTSGVWAPLVADVDGDGVQDVVAILPDGRRVALQGDGGVIPGFGEVRSTAAGPPPILADLGSNGTAGGSGIRPGNSDSGLGSKHVGRGRGKLGGVDAVSRWAHPCRRLGHGPGRTAAGTQVLSQVYGYPNPSSAGYDHDPLPALLPRALGAHPDSGRHGDDRLGPSVGPAALAGSAEHAVLWNHASLASGVYISAASRSIGPRDRSRLREPRRTTMIRIEESSMRRPKLAPVLALAVPR
jgi:hypothetical protein